eukprot:6778894-Pyramimonas_sp.AAC.1
MQGPVELARPRIDGEIDATTMKAAWIKHMTETIRARKPPKQTKNVPTDATPAEWAVCCSHLLS